ncbi:hypothetical protein GJ496_011293 [Pomphorhynchus laevis]|nr:hypothetical protein GJ496_011293 [Pomphorhynchus laevis]
MAKFTIFYSLAILCLITLINVSFYVQFSNLNIDAKTLSSKPHCTVKTDAVANIVPYRNLYQRIGKKDFNESSQYYRKKS